MPMDTNIDQTRMTLRIPNELREALELAVTNGSSSSVTAEIINRLRKSFELHPINADDPHSLIKQCAASIIDIIDKIEPKPKKSSNIKSTPSHPVNDDEKKLLDEFRSLTKDKKKTAVSLFLAITSMIK